jgi:YD repeat-containing protein
MAQKIGHSRVAVANGQSSNGWYQQDSCYDVNGRLSFQSYKYQGSGVTNGETQSCTAAGDTYTYDGLGRLVQTAHSDGYKFT